MASGSGKAGGVEGGVGSLTKARWRLGFGHVQSEHVVIDVQQFGHLADQLVLYALRRELVGLDIELRQHILKELVEVLNQ